jgi:hypothetical protein
MVPNSGHGRYIIIIRVYDWVQALASETRQYEFLQDSLHLEALFISRVFEGMGGDYFVSSR